MGPPGWIVAIMVTSACGRFHFDPIGDDVSGDGGTGTGDGPRGDGAPIGPGMACPRMASPTCPGTTLSLSTSSISSAGGPSAGKGDGLAGSCGGEGAEEQTVQFLVQNTATYTFTTRNANYDTVLYIRDVDCLGAELACNDNFGTGFTSQITLSLVAGQRVVAVVDGANGLCGNASLIAGVNP
jgi:hypothetical protein